MNHVEVVSVATQAMNQISDEDLAKVAQRLNQHHIGLSLGLLAQDNTPRPGAPANCGNNVEGYDSPQETARIAAKLKAGISLRYIAMDEPLWFGHYYNEKNACRSSIDNVAERVAANLAAYVKLFPDVVIGDTVPIGDRPAAVAERLPPMAGCISAPRRTTDRIRRARYQLGAP
jgi:hypothetical protein